MVAVSNGRTVLMHAWQAAVRPGSKHRHAALCLSHSSYMAWDIVSDEIFLPHTHTHTQHIWACRYAKSSARSLEPIHLMHGRGFRRFKSSASQLTTSPPFHFFALVGEAMRELYRDTAAIRWQYHPKGLALAGSPIRKVGGDRVARGTIESSRKAFLNVPSS